MATTATASGTIKNVEGAPLGGIAVVYEATACTVDGTASNVYVPPGGVEVDTECSITVTLYDNETGAPVPEIAVDDIQLAATGTGNTLTPPAGRTNSQGALTWVFESSVAEDKVFTCTVLPAGANVAITGATLTVSGSAVPYPNEPGGYTVLLETDDTKLPATGLLVGDVGFQGSNPSTLLTLADPGGFPVVFPNAQTTVQQFIWETGTVAGDQEAPGHWAGYVAWQNSTFNGANGGPAGDEFSAIYISYYFCVWGNGTDIEIPGNEGFKFFGYLGVANNNQNSSGSGPTMLIVGLDSVGPTDHSPLPKTATEFRCGVYPQLGGTGSRVCRQNLNLDKHVIVGQVHRAEHVLTLGTPGNADGTWRWWLDGVAVGSYLDMRFINSAYASNGDGLAGFWGYQFTPWWGGSGGPNKSRNDYILMGHTYVSGIFLRSRA